MRNRYLIGGIIILAGIYLLYKGFSIVGASLFWRAPDRINVLIYGGNTYFYSLDIKSKQHYYIPFPSALQVDVPGGYGRYRIGSLGKLSALDGNERLIQKTFSITTSSFVHFTFTPGSSDTIYDDELKEEIEKPSLINLLTYESNASFLDRLYLAIHLRAPQQNEFTRIAYREVEDEVLGSKSFQEDTFVKRSIGLLFQPTYRDEQKSTQILFSKSRPTAVRISQVLEGNGIRVSDISLETDTDVSCEVIYSDEEPPQTAIDMSRFFACPLRSGKTDIYDILVVLGEREGEWEIVQ